MRNKVEVSDYLDVRLHFIWAVLSPQAEQRFTGKKLKRSGVAHSPRFH